ncbi:DUF934 domain-containing protein [Deefgea piscis]|uniref:DUF934 domain-containing protein n=1 Tax=Deefgea piscis TaxID=2739061 RepID=UPI001C80FFB0|nr:DUF934 domain-containing protein [Deefgea piscis]QZA80616.1 DUF934 domain-containing protein [Deefgea piscis]
MLDQNPQVIIDREVVANRWVRVVANEEGVVSVPSEGAVLVPYQYWLSKQEELTLRAAAGHAVAVCFAPDDEPESLPVAANHFVMIACDFPAFTDGRGFSIGRLLRERHGFTGELRAVGDVFKDTINYLSRCGFTAFDVRSDKDIVDAAKGLDDFTESYQSSVAQPLPLFRRRAVAA